MMLARILKGYRLQEKMSLRKAARMIGVSHTILFRFESGGDIDSGAWCKIIEWVLSKGSK